MRPARPADASEVAGLLEQLGYPSPEDEVATRLVAAATTEHHHVLVAELRLGAQERPIAGVLALELGWFFHQGARHAHLTSLITDRRWRHRGVARALVAEACLIALRAGCDRLHLRTNLRRDDAHAFYRALGFEETHLAFDKKL